jgi:hypothetical protein
MTASLLRDSWRPVRVARAACQLDIISATTGLNSNGNAISGKIAKNGWGGEFDWNPADGRKSPLSGFLTGA